MLVWRRRLRGKRPLLLLSKMSAMGGLLLCFYSFLLSWPHAGLTLASGGSPPGGDGVPQDSPGGWTDSRPPEVSPVEPPVGRPMPPLEELYERSLRSLLRRLRAEIVMQPRRKLTVSLSRDGQLAWRVDPETEGGLQPPAAGGGKAGGAEGGGGGVGLGETPLAIDPPSPRRRVSGEGEVRRPDAARDSGLDSQPPRQSPASLPADSSLQAPVDTVLAKPGGGTYPGWDKDLGGGWGGQGAGSSPGESGSRWVMVWQAARAGEAVSTPAPGKGGVGVQMGRESVRVVRAVGSSLDAGRNLDAHLQQQQQQEQQQQQMQQGSSPVTNDTADSPPRPPPAAPQAIPIPSATLAPAAPGNHGDGGSHGDTTIYVDDEDEAGTGRKHHGEDKAAVTGGSTPDGAQRRLPQALIIGVKKAGTRALLEFLRAHPDVRAPGPEPHFFDKHYQLGLDWYRKLMPPTLEGQLTIEKTPSYFITREVPRRIFNMSKDVKLIVVVRDPVVRAISDYTQAASKRPDIPPFEQMAFVDNRTGLIDTSWGAIRIGVYAKHLERYLKFFPLRQMLFVSGERLISDPAGEMSRVQEFLGLRPVITASNFYLNETRGFPCLIKPQGSGRPHCLGKTKGRQHPHVDAYVLKRCRDFYRPFNAKFYQMVGQDFGWS